MSSEKGAATGGVGVCGVPAAVDDDEMEILGEFGGEDCCCCCIDLGVWLLVFILSGLLTRLDCCC